ncbi:MAG TPA: Dam family site-specific DNA-(adenine-N6)-methyltransferase, partial [Clostridiales bacterium]|nr:Dam family site-specific DNA-(adenine-N6)-methyltransferase [Clostridiales bacterium]
IKYIEADEFHREKQFYTIREAFNGECDEVTQAVYMVFLNKTCFNGLYRENSEGKFNVPFGRYKNPNFIDEEQLIELSSLLNIKDETGDFKVKIMNTHFYELKDYIDDNSFIYCDPPYRPVTMGGFNSYDKSGFNDESQIELSKFYRVADAKGARIMLSNSDPKVFDPNDDFFENLYQDFNIKRVRAKRTINSDGRGRGEVEELLITNY